MTLAVRAEWSVWGIPIQLVTRIYSVTISIAVGTMTGRFVAFVSAFVSPTKLSSESLGDGFLYGRFGIGHFVDRGLLVRLHMLQIIRPRLGVHCLSCYKRVGFAEAGDKRFPILVGDGGQFERAKIKIVDLRVGVFDSLMSCNLSNQVDEFSGMLIDCVFGGFAKVICKSFKSRFVGSGEGGKFLFQHFPQISGILTIIDACLVGVGD
jgi:hypothetical protein